jgi:hypothetical protein
VQLNGGTPFPIGADGPYKFPTSLPNGTPYTVTIAQNPQGPTQICTPISFVGIVNGDDVENVDITCINSPF